MRRQILLAGMATAVLLLGTSVAASAADIVAPAAGGYDFNQTKTTFVFASSVAMPSAVAGP